MAGAWATTCEHDAHTALVGTIRTAEESCNDYSWEPKPNFFMCEEGLLSECSYDYYAKRDLPLSLLPNLKNRMGY